MIRLLVLLLVLCVASLPAPAQEQPLELTWRDCVQLAGRNNPDLIAALAAMDAGYADYRGSYNAVFPKLSLSTSYSDRSRSGVSLPGTWTAQGGLSLDLINLGHWASIESSLVSYRQTQVALRVAGSATILELHRAFAAVLYNQAAILVNTAIRDSWKINARMVGLRYLSGRESKGNDMNTQAQFLQAEVTLQQSQRDLRVAQQQLAQAIGQDHFSALKVLGEWSTSSPPRPRPDFDELLLKEPRVLLQETVVQQARVAVKTAESNLWPTVSLNYTKGTQGPSFWPQDPFWTFSGTLNYPLFGAGPTATYYASQAAHRSLEQARQDLRSVKNQRRTELESAWSAFARAEDQVRVQTAFLQAAAQRKEESDIRYQNGLMSFEDWIRVITDHVNFQTSVLRAQQGLMEAEAEWQFAKGDRI